MSGDSKFRLNGNGSLWKAALAAVLLVGVLVLSFNSIAILKHLDPTGWDRLVDVARSPAGWGIVLALLILHGAVPYPVTPLIIAAFAAYGPVKGAIIVWSGLMLSGYVSYFIARALEGPILRRYFSPATVDRAQRWVNRWGVWGLFLARVLPVPYALGSFAAGLSTLGLVPFGVASGLGLLPGILTEILASTHSESVLWDVGIFAGTVLIFAFAFAFQQRAESRREESPKQPEEGAMR